MLINIKSEGQRVVNLIRAVRAIGSILPGDNFKIIGEKPVLYSGSIEKGDIQVDTVQMDAFRLFDGLQVILDVPASNRSLGKFLY